MSPAAINILAILFISLVLFLIIWPLRKNLTRNPKLTIILTMAALIFIITIFTIIKTYRDYQDFLVNITSHEVIISNIVFALFLDFSILMIGGLFLYLANQLYTSDFIKQEPNEKPAGSGKQNMINPPKTNARN
jgi:glucan phosphoethanolaminetransferase (alkaline phosphatase superfamily)